MASKTTPKKAALATPKKKAVKKAVTKTSSVKKSAVAAEEEFFQFRVTTQTLYWAILGIVAISFAVWLYTLDAKVRDLYDQLDASTYSSDIRPIIKEQPEGETEQSAADAEQSETAE